MLTNGTGFVLLVVMGASGYALGYMLCRYRDRLDRMDGFGLLGLISEDRPIGPRDILVAFDPNCLAERRARRAQLERARRDTVDPPFDDSAPG